jgi:predicted nucleic acid-binding Zn ribbon protein
VIRVGEVHCGHCGDPFEPDGLPSFEGPNFCSTSCEDLYEDERRAYDEARYGGASVF